MSEKFVKMVLWNTKFRIIPTFRSLPLNQNRVAHIAVVLLCAWLGGCGSPSLRGCGLLFVVIFSRVRINIFLGGGYIFICFRFINTASASHFCHTPLSRRRRPTRKFGLGQTTNGKNRLSLHAPPLQLPALLLPHLLLTSHPLQRRRPRWHCATIKQRQAVIALLHNSLTQNQQKPFSFPTHSNATFRDCTCHVCLRARIAGAPSSGADAARKSTCSP